MNKNTSGQKVTLTAVNTSTGALVSGDAANLTAYVSKDDGTVTVLADASATEADATNAKGDYLFDLAQAESNADKLRFTGKSSTSNVIVVPQTIYTRPANFSALAITNGQAIGTSTLTADTLLDNADAVETGLTIRKAFRLLCAVIGGKMSGGGSGTEVFRNAVADSKDRVTATTTGVGNRTAITTDLT